MQIADIAGFKTTQRLFQDLDEKIHIYLYLIKYDAVLVQYLSINKRTQVMYVINTFINKNIYHAIIVYIFLFT